MARPTCCKVCVYWEKIVSDTETPRGECRYYPPRPKIMGELVTSNVVWPITRATDSCGEGYKE